jgi:iron complex outermembrane receptor protein
MLRSLARAAAEERSASRRDRVQLWFEARIGDATSNGNDARRHQWRRGPLFPAPWLGGRACLIALARLAPLVACAGALTVTSPAGAQSADVEPEASQPAEAVPVTEESLEAEPLPEDPPEIYEGDLAEVVVTGFRVSLGAALLRKQRATGQVDAIVADDIADFPDLNLAESLQRIPGVTITRNAGEGARITVRGLSGLYTRTRVNGMDTRVGVGANTGRDFDFNLFASELFNSIVVHKTATAELGDGSLGAVVDLNTGRAFNYKDGFTFVANAQGNYNDLSDTVRPRLAALASYRDPGGVWGATASAAYSMVRNDEAIGDTVRWAKANFRSVNGVACADNPGDVGCAEVSSAFHARIPRYAESIATAERLGLTAGVQLRPTDHTEVRLDALYATYVQRTDFKTIEVLFRGNEGGMDVTNYLLERNPDRYGVGNNTLTALAVDNAWVRSETFRRNTDTDFHQLTLAIDHDFTPSLSAHVLAGTSRSKGHIPRQTTLMYDDRDYNGYVYDYSQDTRFPQLAFNGPDVTDAATFTLTELRDQVHTTKNAFDTVDLRLNWRLVDALRFSVGANYKNMDFDTKQRQRDGQVCGLQLPGGVDLFDCDVDDDGMDELLGPQGQAAFTDITEYSGQTGTGSTRRWASASLEGWTGALGYYNVSLRDDLGSIRTVREQNIGAHVQADGEVEWGESGMRLMYNAGVRYVETHQTSGGYVSSDFIEIDRPKYDDWLPSANAALWLSDELVLRLAAAQVMSRPQLGDLSPGGAVDSFNYRINFQNPRLDPTRAIALDASTEWYFADESLLSLALFWKKIDSFPLRASRQGTFAETGLPATVVAPTSPAEQSLEGTCGDPVGCWEISELTNGPGATLRGLEVGFQSPFSTFYAALPPIIRGMGFMGNFTLLGSDTTYDFSGNSVKERLFGLSNRSFNATLYYEDSKFGARVSVANRSDYLTGGPNVNDNLWEFVEQTTRVDFSSSYYVLKNLEISFEALNLTDTPYDAKVDVDANRRLLYNRTGRNFLLGARFSY